MGKGAVTHGLQRLFSSGLQVCSLSSGCRDREPAPVRDGKSVVSAAGDLTSHTTAADGYIVVNKLKTTNGTATLEVPQNSIGDDFLRRWARWARSTASPNRIALGTLTIYDAVAGFTIVCTGVRYRILSGCNDNLCN